MPWRRQKGRRESGVRSRRRCGAISPKRSRPLATDPQRPNGSAAALEGAEQRATDAERNAAVLGEEVAALKTELVDARELGRSTLQALALSNVGSIYREPRLGWRHAMRRLFGIVRSR